MRHYNGSSNPEHHILTERHKLSNIFYKNDVSFNFETFSTNIKATFDTIEKYGVGRSEREKVGIFPENIRTTNQKLGSAITFCVSNHNAKYLTATIYLGTQIIFVSTSHQPNQQNNVTVTNKMCHMLRRKSSVRPSRAMKLTYLIQKILLK